MHLEVGSALAFKDEFFDHAPFDSLAKFSEIHLYELAVFTRVSKRRFGGELGVGFEKAGYRFSRYANDSTLTRYIQLNRITTDVSALFYLVKKAQTKLDVQCGIRNYFNMPGRLYLPDVYAIRSWSVGGRAGINYTYRSFLCGLFYEYPLRKTYPFQRPDATFGLRVGVIY